MAAKMVDIMELRQLLLLKQKGESNRSCSRMLNIHRNTINYYVQLFAASGAGYGDLLAFDDARLTELFPSRGNLNTTRYGVLASYFTYFEKELKKPGCTREVLWQEYLSKHPDGYRYTQFNEHFTRWLKTLKGSGKLTHTAGDKMYVDYTGKKLHVTDKQTGEVQAVEVFVAILPASQYTYVEASTSQGKEDFIDSVNRCLHFFTGTPKSIVTDNLKSAVHKASKYEAVLNKSFKALALHYKTTINPTRSFAPQDKALVEGVVKLVYQRIFYPLGKVTFFSLEALNRAIREKLTDFNDQLMKQLEASRLKQFLDVEKPYLAPLPAEPYELKEFKKAKVQKMGFVYLHQDKNYYSVPFRYVGHTVEVQYNSREVEVYLDSQRIALHKRNYRKGTYTKIDEHLSSYHRFYQDWSPDFFKNWARKSGPHVEAYVNKLLEKAAYPEVVYKQCLGVINLKTDYTDQRLDNACRLALEHPRHGYHIIKNILANKMDILGQSALERPHIAEHPNIRGARFYN